MGDLPSISVVIPTVGRPTLTQAVESALSQSFPPKEVWVVYDLPSLPKDTDFRSEKVRCLVTGGGQGPNAARSIGVSNATGEAVAFLDDDDYWYESKLAVQAGLFADLRRSGARPIVVAAADAVTQEGDVVITSPLQPIHPGQKVADYLFVRRTVRQSTAMGPSGLLVDVELLREVPLAQNLRLHEDWDWLIRVGEQPGVAFATTADHVAAYRVRPPGGPRDPDTWRMSQAWADANRPKLSPREYGDFLLTVTAAIAVDSGQRIDAVRIVAGGMVRGRPGWQAVIFAVALIVLPHDLRPRLLATISGLRRKRARSARS